MQKNKERGVIKNYNWGDVISFLPGTILIYVYH